MNERNSFPEHVGPSVEPGTVIAGRYVLLRSCAGDARPRWLARETQRNLLFSLQVMRPADGERAREPFEREMEEVTQLDHPQLVRVLDYGWDEAGYLFAAEERVDARSLAELIEVETFSPVRSVELVAQLLSLLEVVHNAGLTHGDLEPCQLLVRRSSTDDKEELLLRGLGCARFSPYHLTPPPNGPGIAAEWVVGSPEYASPEQLRGAPHDIRSDLYAVGVLLFRLLTGRAPFAARQALDVAWLQRFTLPPPPSTYVALSPELEAVCLKALSKTPELRYQSASEMQEALHAAHPRLQAVAADRTSRASLRARRAAARSRAKTLAIQIPASRVSAAVSAIEVRDSEAPPARSEAGFWVALALLGCTLTAVGVVAAPRLGFGESAEEDELPPPAEVLETAVAQARASSRPARPREPVVRAEPVAPAAPPPVAEPASANADGALAAAATDQPPPVTEPAPANTDVALANTAADRPPPGAAPPEAADSVQVTPVAAAEVKSEAAPPERKSEAASPSAANANANPPAKPPAAKTKPITIKRAAATRPATGEPSGDRAIAAAPGAAPASTPAAEAAASPTAPPSNVASADSDPQAPPVTYVGTDADQLPVTLGSGPRGESVHVVVGRTRLERGAVSSGSLREALNVAALERCYVETPEFAGPMRVRTELQFETELTGRISSATVSGLSGQSLPPSFVSCVEQAVRFGRVRDVDTGAVSASVELFFQRIVRP